MGKDKFDAICEKITKDIIHKIETEDLKFEDMWCKVGVPLNVVSHEAYQGFNQMYLGYVTNQNRYTLPYFCSFKQAKDFGGSVKKGEQGHPIVFWKKYAAGTDKKNEDQDYEGDPSRIKMVPFHYTVFNIEQTEGCEFKMPESKVRPEISMLEACEQILAGYESGPEICHENKARAYYSPSLDLVNIPNQTQFASDEFYYSVMFHELVHSTGHKSRLDRFKESICTPFASTEYSREELIAELGASYLCMHAGITAATFKNSVSYLKGWCSKFKDKPRELMTASNAAVRACKVILGDKFT